MAITLVQAKSGTGTAASLTVTLTTPTTAGNCVIICWGVFATTTQPTTFTPTLGGSAGNFTSAINAGPNEGGIFVDPNCAGGQTAVQLATSGSSGSIVFGMYVYEVSGLVTSSVVDKTVSSVTAGSTSWTTGTTATTTQASEFWVGFAALYQTTTQTVTGPSSPWTNETAIHPANGANFLNSISGHQIVSSTGTCTYSGTVGSSGGNIGVAATLKGATGTPASVTGVVATSASAAPTGTLAAGATIAGVTATSASAALTGTLAAGATITGAVAAATAAAPTGTAGAVVSVTGVTATAASAAPIGTVQAGGTVAGQVAASTSAAPTGSPSVPQTVTGVVATSASAAPIGTVNATGVIAGVVAHSASAAPTGAPAASASVTGVVAHSSSTATPGTPTVTGVVPVSVVNTWTASRQAAGAVGGAMPEAPAQSLGCPLDPSGSGTWLIAYCSWVFPSSVYLGSTVAVTDNVHGVWFPIGAPNTDSSATGFTRSSIWAKPNTVVTSNVYVSPCGSPGPIYPTAIGVTVIEVQGMSDYLGTPVVVTHVANSATSITGNAATPSAKALMLTVAASDAAALTGPGGTWTTATGITISSGPSLLFTSPAWQVATTSKTASWTTSTGDLSACTATILVSNPAPSQMNPNWPYTQLLAGFGAGALTPPSEITWTDITDRFLTGQQASSTKGKQYELDQLEASNVTITLDNNDGALDPTNTASVFWPNVLADVPIQLLMVWQGRTYSVFQGFVERWPQTWDATWYGIAEVTITDCWSLQTAMLSAVQQQEILSDAPYAYWTCGDAAGSPYAGNTAPGNTNALIPVLSKNGALTAVAAFGVDSGINAGDPSGTLWSQSGLTAGDQGYGYALMCTDPDYPLISNGMTVMGWFNPTGGGTQVSASVILMRGSNAGTGPIWQVILGAASGGTPGALQVSTWDATARTVTTVTADSRDWFTAGLFHIALVFNTTEWALYLNGVSAASATGQNMTATMSWVSFMGAADRFTTGSMINGECGHLAIFGQQLTTDRITSIYLAGSPNPILTPGIPQTSTVVTEAQFATEFAQQRIERLLGYGGWSGPRSISQESATEMAGVTDIQGTTGNVSANGIVRATQGQTTNQAVTNIVISDAGFMSVDGPGVLCYLSRGDLYNQAPDWYLGELTGNPANQNWSFISGVAPWTAFGGTATITQSTVFTYQGYPSCLLTPDGTTVHPGMVSEDALNIAGNTSYTAMTVVTCPTGFAGGLIAEIQWYDDTNTLISTATGSAVPLTAGHVLLAGVTATSPPGTVSATMTLLANGTPSHTTLMYFALTTLQPTATAGPAGEHPYEPDASLGYDKSLLYNDAELTQSTGTGTAIVAFNVASTTQHGVYTYSQTVYEYDVNVVIDQANWIANTKGVVYERAEQLRVVAISNPLNWPLFLGVNPAQPVNVARRPTSAAPGIMLQAVTTQVTHQMDFAAGSADVTIQTDSFPEGAVLSADDQVFGQLNGINLLAW